MSQVAKKARVRDKSFTPPRGTTSKMGVMVIFMKKRLTFASVFICVLVLIGLVSCSASGSGKPWTELPIPGETSDFIAEESSAGTADGASMTAEDNTVNPTPITETVELKTSDTLPPEPESTGDQTADTMSESGAASDTTDIPDNAGDTEKAEPKKPVQKNGKTVYLTFDDGPHKENTGKILSILDEYGVKATFFTVGKRVEIYAEQLKAIRDAGHAVGCHSYDHDYSRLTTPDGVTDEISEWEAAAEKALGEIPEEKLFRFPGGSPVKDENKCRAQVASLGYRGYDWNCLDNDCLIKKCPEGKDVEEWMKESFISTYKYGSSIKGAPLIVLAHETYIETVDILGWMIEFLQNEGYDFGTLDEIDSWYY